MRTENPRVGPNHIFLHPSPARLLFPNCIIGISSSLVHGPCSLSFFRLRMVRMKIIVFRHQCTSFSAQLMRTCCIPRCPHPWRDFAQFIEDAVLLVDPRDYFSVMRGHYPVEPRRLAFRAEEAESNHSCCPQCDNILATVTQFAQD